MQELEKDAKMCKYRVWSRTWKMEFSTATLFLCFVDAMVLPISTTINRHFLYLIIHAQIGCRPMRVVITRPVPLNDEQTMYIYINRIIFFFKLTVSLHPLSSTEVYSLFTDQIMIWRVYKILGPCKFTFAPSRDNIHQTKDIKYFSDRCNHVNKLYHGCEIG